MEQKYIPLFQDAVEDEESVSILFPRPITTACRGLPSRPCPRLQIQGLRQHAQVKH